MPRIYCTRIVLIISLAFGVSLQTQAQNLVPDDVELAALKDIYFNLGGGAWANETNWPTRTTWPASATSAQFGTWFGITVSGGDITYITLNGNLLKGTLPPSIGNLTGLQYLYLWNNQLSGPIPPSVGNLVNLGSMRLENNALTGPLPDLSRLTRLGQFMVHHNQLSGPVLSSYFGTSMNDFQISYNQFDGPFPNISGWSNITSLVINNNLFKGAFPSTANLTKLSYISAAYNQFTSIPTSVINLTKGAYIGFDNNTLKSITNLATDYASNAIHPSATLNLLLANNQLDFSQLEILTSLGIPTLSYKPQNLINDFTSATYLPGGNLVIKSRDPGQNSTITWEKKQPNNSWLNVNALNQDVTQKTFTRTTANATDNGVYRWSMTNSQVTGLTLQSSPITVTNESVSDAIEFAVLKDIYDQLGGLQWPTQTNWPTAPWPASATSAEFGKWFGVTVTNGDITSISLSNNNLNGTIPVSIGNLQSLTYLAFHVNRDIKGEIPATIGDISVLGALYLYQCGLSGTLPPSIFNLKKLVFLGLGDNKIEGSIPENIGNATSLFSLGLGNNKLQGSIPVSLTNLSNLSVINLANNGLGMMSPIPSWIGSFPKLTTLYLQYNQFKGPIPPEINNLTNLVTLNLGQNQLSGIPDLSSLVKLQQLALGYNPLNTTIPAWVTNLTELRNLSIPGAGLTGSIPPSLANLTKLVGISLNYNQLTGAIPDLSGLTNLSYLTLSNNKLTSMANLISASDIALDNNELISIPNFSNQVNKANLILALGKNQLDFSQLEALVNAGIKTVSYVPQKDITGVNTISIPLNTPLTIATRPTGAFSTVIWEKLNANGTTWSTLTNDQDAVANTYTRSSAALADMGTYRWKMTNTKVTALILQSVPIVVSSRVPGTYYAIASGAWTDPAIWSSTEGGAPSIVYPAEGDVVNIKGYNVTINSGVTCSNVNITVVNDATKLKIDGSGAALTVKGKIYIEGAGNTNAVESLVVSNDGKIDVVPQ